MWIVLSINNSRYQSWQVSVLIWSIELSISYVSLKSDNITYVEMSYVLAFFNYTTIYLEVLSMYILSIERLIFLMNCPNSKDAKTTIYTAEKGISIGAAHTLETM